MAVWKDPNNKVSKNIEISAPLVSIICTPNMINPTKYPQIVLKQYGIKKVLSRIDQGTSPGNHV